jgi:hypothetical protein
MYWRGRVYACDRQQNKMTLSHADGTLYLTEIIRGPWHATARLINQHK